MLRGENHYQSKHVEAFMYSSGVLKGKVCASMKDKVYIKIISSVSLKSLETQTRKLIHTKSFLFHKIIVHTLLICLDWNKKSVATET